MPAIEDLPGRLRQMAEWAEGTATPAQNIHWETARKIGTNLRGIADEVAEVQAMASASRADVLSGLLDRAFDELLWISDAPNRNEHIEGTALELAERARAACAEIERRDPDKEHVAP